MNVLLVKIGTEPGLESIVTKLKDFEPQVRTFGVTSTPVQDHPFDVRVSSSYEAMLGAHDEYLTQGLYVRPDLFRKIAKYEGQLLRMLERVAIHDLTSVKSPPPPIPQFIDSVDDRSQLLLRMVAFWDFAIDLHQIDAIVAQNYGHNGWDAVIQVVAEARNIPYLFFHEVRPFLGSLYVHENSSEIGQLELGAQLLRVANERFQFIDDFEMRRAKMLTQVGIGRSEGDSSASQNARSRGRQLLVRFKRPRTLPRRIRKSLQRRRRNKASITDETNAVFKKAIEGDFVFCEVQSQPNATTAVKGWMYPDQRELLAQVAKSLPDTWKLVVKESDRQWSRMYPRRRSYWSQIAAIPNVIVVSHDRSSLAMMKQSRAVIETSYSTLALEAILHGTPVLIFGVSHINNLPNVYRVESDEQVAAALREINRKNVQEPSVSEIHNQLNNFVEETLRATIPGSLSSVPSFVNDVSKESYLDQTTTKVAAVIAAWISNLPQNERSSVVAP